MFSSYQYWNQTKIIQSLEKLILHKQGEQLENLDWPHLEVLKAACRIDTSSAKDEFLKDQAHEWIRIFTNLK
jgi:mannose/cellobiose epimerase-like protein (N-acyl-D-glucosamine 2-epimerase family)